MRFSIKLLPLFILVINNAVNAQVCTAKIQQKDTTVCPGTSLQLTVSVNDSSDLCNTYSLSSNLQNGLLGWYPFCGNTNDISSAGNNGFATGPLTYTADRYNNPNTAIKFSGSGESVRTNKIDRTTANSFSYVVWVNTQNTVTLPTETIDPSSGFSIDLATPCVIHATHGFNWNLNNQHTGAGLYVASNGVFVVEHTNSIVATPLSWSGSLDGWHSIAVVYESHLPKLYVDGEFIKNGLVTPYIVHPSLGCDSFFINGTYPYITSGFGKGFKPSVVSVPFNNFKGEIDDIKVYNRALTANEIAELYSKDKSSILWSNGDTTKTITISLFQDTSFSVTVNNSLGSCRDTVKISLKSCTAFPCDETGIINNDTSVCSGTQVSLHAKNALSYKWYPAKGLSDTSIQNPLVTAGNSMTYYLNSTAVLDNLIFNGDFEQGNTAFTTTYTYCNSGNCLFPLANNGYSVGNNASFFHSSFQGKDHTSGAGNFMIINGADPNLTVWKKTINISPNTNYAFGVWISTMIVRNTAKIRFSINGVQLGPIFDAPEELNKWVQVYTNWNSGNNTTATIEIVDTFNEPNGNDFGLDDIFFAEVVSCTDSINIKTLLPVKTNVAASICKGQNYILPSGDIVTSVGLYNDTVKSSSGCDSLITVVNLTVSAPVTNNITTSICSGDTYTLPSGLIVNTANIYADTLKNSSGCDSLITVVNLKLNSSKVISSNASICPGKTFTLPSGLTVNTAGIYNDTIKSTSGCDSLITVVNVTVFAPVTKSLSASTCSGKLYTLPSGLTVGEAGIYVDTIRTASGCDSVINTVDLSIIKPTEVNTDTSICSNDRYTLPSGLTANTTGIYKDTVRSSNGCDSLISVVNLTVNRVSAITINKSNDIDCVLRSSELTASGGDAYIWTPSSSLDNSTIYNPVATPGSTTVYTVSSTIQGCVAKDSIEVKVITGDTNNGYLVASAFTPNSDSKNDCFSIKSWGFVTNLNLSIFDRWSHLVFHTTDPSSCWDGSYRGEKLETAAFIYDISAVTNCGKIFRKGIVSLIR